MAAARAKPAPMVPLRVRARLAGGIAQAAPWGIALDGLLASHLWSSQKAAAREAGRPEPDLRGVIIPDDLGLPLARCSGAGGTSWHWASTCAFPEERPAACQIEVRYWMGRIDHRHAGEVAEQLPLVVSDQRGRYRARRMPLLVTPCRSVAWQAIGDIDAVRALLAGIASIGKKRSVGEGRVLGWEVEALVDVDEWDAAHLHPNGALGRPCPAACVAGRDVQTGGVGAAGLRPPYMHPGRQQELVLPVFLDTEAVPA